MSRFTISLGLLVLLTATPGWSATLESPVRGARLSGLGFISGWKCNANHITVRIDGDASMPVAMHQPRQDTQSACGGTTDNGFIAQMNWALLGDGTHTIVAYDDDVQFASATFEVVTLDQEFVQGANGVFEMRNFPNPGDVTLFEWNESTQHMELSEYHPSTTPVALEPVYPSRMNGQYPTRHTIHGFDVWVSPTVYESPDYTPAVLNRELDIIRAQLLWIVSHDALPLAAIRQIIDSDVSIYLDTPSNPSAWWNCGEGVGATGCYSPGLNRVGIPIVDTPYYGGSYLQRDHTRESILLHEMAHVFHWEVIRGDSITCVSHSILTVSRYTMRPWKDENKVTGDGGVHSMRRHRCTGVFHLARGLLPKPMQQRTQWSILLKHHVPCSASITSTRGTETSCGTMTLKGFVSSGRRGMIPEGFVHSSDKSKKISN